MRRVWPLNFNKQLSGILVTCFCPAYLVNDLILFQVFFCVWVFKVDAAAWLQSDRVVSHHLNWWVFTRCFNHISLSQFNGEWLCGWTKAFIGKDNFDKINNIELMQRKSWCINRAVTHHLKDLFWSFIRSILTIISSLCWLVGL